jgi:succinate dehydrogenase / fumarate reductase, flavoprotein subunit
MNLNSKIPAGNIQDKWNNHKFSIKLVNPANKRKYNILVVGSGLAGASAAASLGELGYNVSCFCYQDSPRRAHSIAAQGGINAAKNYQNDGDSIYRLFYDTVKGGDYRAREANVHRLAEVSGNIIDQCVAQGVPFARDYGGLLDNRSFGGSQVSRTFYARGQTGQQLLLGAYSALNRQIAAGSVKMYNRHEMLDVVVEDGRAVGIITRNMVNGAIERWAADAVILATGGYSNVYFLSTNAIGCNVTAAFRAYRRGAGFANPCYTQIHPTCIPIHGDQQSKLTLMSESLRNDGRVWVPKHKETAAKIRHGEIHPSQVAEADRDYFLERKYPSFGNLAPRDISSRSAKEACDDGRGIAHNEGGNGVFLDFADAINRLGKAKIVERYGNLFDMYECITGVNGYETPMQIYPALHYTMGGLWVDYNLMTSVPGLFALGECNFSDHGANRLGASALMQGLADGYFVIPYTIGDYLAGDVGLKNAGRKAVDTAGFNETVATVKERTQKMLSIKGKTSPRVFHKELGRIMWEYAGMARNEEGLKTALKKIPALREEFWNDVKVVGGEAEMNHELERAGRVADFLEFGELLCIDALDRKESCGGHFREESQTPDGEAKRDDENFCHVSVWEFKGDREAPVKHKEELNFENCKLQVRSYK